MIFRLSQKLTIKIKTGPLPALQLHENPLADWSAHLFLADRTQYILLTNTQSLYSTVMYGKGITHDSDFIERALSNIREFMEGEGQGLAYERFIAPASATVRFARAPNRSVTGSMNDLTKHAAYWLAEGEVSPSEIGFRLQEIPMSALKHNGLPLRDSTGRIRGAGEQGTIIMVVEARTVANGDTAWTSPLKSCPPSSTHLRPTSVWRIEPSSKCRTTNSTPLSMRTRTPLPSS
jgi:hypothetical protein